MLVTLNFLKRNSSLHKQLLQQSTRLFLAGLTLESIRGHSVGGHPTHLTHLCAGCNSSAWDFTKALLPLLVSIYSRKSACSGTAQPPLSATNRAASSRQRALLSATFNLTAPAEGRRTDSMRLHCPGTTQAAPRRPPRDNREPHPGWERDDY